jgi:hypothetical protein
MRDEFFLSFFNTPLHRFIRDRDESGSAVGRQGTRTGITSCPTSEVYNIGQVIDTGSKRPIPSY